MSRFGDTTKCPGCGEPLGKKTCKGWRDERTPWSDEFVDELHECSKCGTWCLVTHLERFTGEETTNVRGPMTAEDAQSWLERNKNSE